MSRNREQVWMMQWRDAEAALRIQRARELAAMTDEKALAAAEAVLELAARVPPHPARLLSSGLVDQQARFHRQRSR